MSVIMDNRLDTGDKDEEVKKLQDLVKELKLQNEELRSERESLLSNTKGSDSVEKNEKESAESEKSEKLRTENEESKSRYSSVDSIPFELNLALGISDYQSSDEETWLFDSPKTNSYNEEWLRKDLDDPSLVLVKRSLVKKLDEIANSPRHSPRHSLYSPSSSSGVLSPESPPSSRGEIDSRTFIRPKKRRPLAFERFNDENRNNVIKKEVNGITASSQAGLRSNSREYLGRSNGSLGSEEEDRMSSASDGSYSSFRLADVEDVNTLARLQEESLKLPDPQSVNRMSPGVRISSGLKEMPHIHRSQNNGNIRTKTGSSGDSANSSQEDLLTSPSGSHSNIRRLTPRSGLQPPRKYSSGIQPPSSRSREGSDMSTPPDSPYNSQQNLETYNGRTTGSRLPSLTRRLGGSEPKMLDHQGSPNTSRTTSPLPLQYHQDSKTGSAVDLVGQGRTSRLQAPQTRPSRLSAPSPVRIPLRSTHLSEVPRANPSELFRPKPISNNSGLPRPGSRLQPPKPRLSESPANPSAQSDWREGCY